MEQRENRSRSEIGASTIESAILVGFLTVTLFVAAETLIQNLQNQYVYISAQLEEVGFLNGSDMRDIGSADLGDFVNFAEENVDNEILL
jgi:Flp pilus assembly pilin Flp